MKLLSQTTETITQKEFIIELPTGAKVTYIEWINEDGKVTDVSLRDKNGFETEDPILYETVLMFLDDLHALH